MFSIFISPFKLSVHTRVENMRENCLIFSSNFVQYFSRLNFSYQPNNSKGAFNFFPTFPSPTENQHSIRIIIKTKIVKKISLRLFKMSFSKLSSQLSSTSRQKVRGRVVLIWKDFWFLSRISQTNSNRHISKEFRSAEALRIKDRSNFLKLSGKGYDFRSSLIRFRSFQKLSFAFPNPHCCNSRC